MNEEAAMKHVIDVDNIIRENTIPMELVVNFDETSVFMDQIPSHSYDLKGTKHPYIKTSAGYKKRITAGFGVSATGEKLTPLLIFKRVESKRL